MLLKKLSQFYPLSTKSKQNYVVAYEAFPKLDPERDPLQWWKMQSPRFPGLCKLAQSYLSVCATSSSSERLFSTSGNIVTPQRASLKPDKVDMLIF